MPKFITTFLPGLLITTSSSLLARLVDALDINDPSGSDPQSPPKSIYIPTAKPASPFPSGIPTQPDQCDGQTPSDECLSAMTAGSGGYLWFAKDSECSDKSKSSLTTAVWDATTFANYASHFAGSARGQASAIFYMGSNFASQETRIAGNLRRAGQFKSSNAASDT